MSELIPDCSQLVSPGGNSTVPPGIHTQEKLLWNGSGRKTSPLLFHQKLVLLFLSCSSQHHINNHQLNSVFHFFMLKEKHGVRMWAKLKHSCVPIIQMKIADLFLEIIIASIPGNHDPEPKAFPLWISSAVADVTELFNKLINAHICSEQKFYVFQYSKHVNSTMQKIEWTMKEEITLFRMHGVNPESVSARWENKQQR